MPLFSLITTSRGSAYVELVGHDGPSGFVDIFENHLMLLILSTYPGTLWMLLNVISLELITELIVVTLPREDKLELATRFASLLTRVVLYVSATNSVTTSMYEMTSVNPSRQDENVRQHLPVTSGCDMVNERRACPSSPPAVDVAPKTMLAHHSKLH